MLAMAVGLLAMMSAGQPSSRASSLPQGFSGGDRVCVHPHFSVGAELARDGGGSVGDDVGWAAVIASKLGSHRGARVETGFASTTHSSVGASLLAMAVGLLAVMSAGQPSSRASSAPTEVLGWRQGLRPPLIPVWELGCWRESLCLYWCCTCTIELTCTRACICSAPPPRRMPRTGQASR